MNYSYYYLMQYLPTRYEATQNEWNNRREVWNFKDGVCSDRILNEMVKTVNEIVGYAKSNYIICFIPASRSSRTQTRYSSLARKLTERTGVFATLDAVKKNSDSVSGYVAGKSSNPTADFIFNANLLRGKKVILIDDVITRGRTFTQTASKILANGASSVTGMFVAKTVNPDWNNMVA